MKSISVQSLVEKFHLEVLAGAGRMDRNITRQGRTDRVWVCRLF